ncbi:fosfomycin resistance protein FosB [compost metagenome]
MITGVKDVYYSVTDVKRAKQFYIEALGMKLSFEHEHWIALDCGGVQIGLHPEENPIPSIPRDSHGSHAGATLTLKSNDVKEDRKRIESFGGKILGEADQPWGHMLVFEDPDGNVLKLMNPK